MPTSARNRAAAAVRSPGSSGGKPPPVYHRLENGTTQTGADGLRQQRSGELWGAPARGSAIPSVKACKGPLPPGRSGIEFTTPVPPAPNKPPRDAIWYHGHQAGVALNGQGFAVIPITATRRVP